MLLILATLAAGLIAGAAIYITAVQQPARLACGAELAVRELAPRYQRATLMQEPLALIACESDSTSPEPHGHEHPSDACQASRPGELPRPPAGSLPCELFPPGFEHAGTE